MPTSVSTRSSGSLNPTRQQLDELDALLKRMLELPVNPVEESDPAETEIEESLEEPPPPLPVARPQAVRPATPPVSYMVVETASPRPLPPASGFEPRPTALTPRLVPVTPTEEEDAAEMPEPPALDIPEPAAQEPDDAEVWVPLRSTWQPSPQTWPPLADSWHQAHGVAALPDPQPEPELREFVPPQPTIAPISLPIEPVQRKTPIEEPPIPEPPVPVNTAPPPSVPAPAAPRLSLTVEDAPVSESRALLPLVWFNQGFDSCMAPLGGVGRWLCSSRGRQTLGLVGLACLVAAAAIVLCTGTAWSQ